MTPLVVLGGLVHLLILLTVIWRGGVILGSFQETLRNWATDAQALRADLNQHSKMLGEQGNLLAATVSQLDSLTSVVERVVQRLDKHMDNHSDGRA